MRPSHRVAALAATVTLTLTAGIPALAATNGNGNGNGNGQSKGNDKTACAKEQKKVDKAEDALARVTAVFAKQKTHAGSPTFVAAKAEKKAQKQRLLKATARLAQCQAGQDPTPTPTVSPTPTTTPTVTPSTTTTPS